MGRGQSKQVTQIDLFSAMILNKKEIFTAFEQKQVLCPTKLFFMGGNNKNTLTDMLRPWETFFK